MLRNVLLVRENSSTIENLKQPIHIHPPLSLKYIESMIKTQLNIPAEVVDFWVDFGQRKRRLSQMESSPASVFVFEVSIFNVTTVYQTLQKLRQGVESIIIGISRDIELNDPHFEFLEPFFDFFVTGDPEEEVFRLIKTVKEEGKEVLKFWSHPKARKGSVTSLDALPFPQWTKEELDKYQFIYPLRVNRPVYAGYLSTSRGCAFNCIYCCGTIRKSEGKALRTRSLTSIIEEIKYLKTLGVNTIFFEDDNFVNAKTHYVPLCQEIIRQKLDINWVASGRVDGIDEQTLKVMKDSGCVLLLFGLESGNERVIDILEKTPKSARAWLDQSRTIVKEAKKLGIGSCAMFIIGNPDETREEIEDTMKFAKELNADIIKVHYFTPYPKSPIYQRLKNKVQAHKLMESYHYRESKINLSKVNSEDLKKLRGRFYRKFIFRPQFVFPHIKNHFHFYLHNRTVFRRLFSSLGSFVWPSQSSEDQM